MIQQKRQLQAAKCEQDGWKGRDERKRDAKIGRHTYGQDTATQGKTNWDGQSGVDKEESNGRRKGGKIKLCTKGKEAFRAITVI